MGSVSRAQPIITMSAELCSAMTAVALLVTDLQQARIVTVNVKEALRINIIPISVIQMKKWRTKRIVAIGTLLAQKERFLNTRQMIRYALDLAPRLAARHFALMLTGAGTR